MIRDAELIDGRRADVRIARGRILAVGGLAPESGEAVLDAAGGLLLPGLHDHHLHLAATAAAFASVNCGPPQVADAEALAARLAAPGTGWARGIGYHESVAGLIDRDWLDRAAPTRPVRVQHRSGRLWVFNTAGLGQVLAAGLAPPAGLERERGRWTGRLYDEDAWLRRALGSMPPDLAQVGARLAGFGVTGVTDMSPANDDATARWLAAEQARRALPQRLLLAGRREMGAGGLPAGIGLGPVKIHLHEAHLPDFETTAAIVRDAHARGRGVAVHCVTAAELAFTLAVLREAGPIEGDRIEHAAVASDDMLDEIAAQRLSVTVQPNFVGERGDAYRAMIPEAEWSSLYRLRAFLDRRAPLAGGSDAPFGAADPWAAMAAAVSRRTPDGALLGEADALTPEEARDLFLADPVDLARARAIDPGAPADLCLLDRPWRAARKTLGADLVRATFIGGRIVHHRIHQAPLERL